MAQPATALPQQEWRPKHSPFLIAVVVTLATFMEVLDTSIANVALPHIAGNLGAGQDESTWILTSYLVSNAIVLPLSAWFSTLIGRKNFYMACVALFTISSALCGLAPSLAMLIFFRVLQGVGGGGLQPSEQAILADTFSPAQRGMGFAIYGVAVVTAPAIGPTLGGFITDNFDWRWIFFINVPVGILSLFLTHRLVEDPPHVRAQVRTGKLRIDYVGISLLALGLGSLQVVLDKGQQEDWLQSTFIVGFLVAAVIGIVGAVVWELVEDKPAVDFRLLKERNFASANALMFMVGFVLLGSTVLLPLMMQSLFGYSAEDAGMVISPGGFLIMALMPLVGFLIGRTQPRFLIGFGLVLTAGALWHMTSFSLQLDFWGAARARMWQAAGLAFLFVPINAIAYAYVPKEKNNNASALINLSRNIGGSVGIAFVITFLARRAQYHQQTMVSHLTPGTAAYEQFLTRVGSIFNPGQPGSADAAQHAQAMLYATINRQANMQAFVDCYWLLAIVFACMIPMVFFLKKPKPGAVSMGH